MVLKDLTDFPDIVNTICVSEQIQLLGDMPKLFLNLYVNSIPYKHINKILIHQFLNYRRTTKIFLNAEACENWNLYTMSFIIILGLRCQILNHYLKSSESC